MVLSSQIASQHFDGPTTEGGHLVLAKGRDVAVSSDVDTDQVPARVHVDNLAQVAVLEHGTINKHVVNWNES